MGEDDYMIKYVIVGEQGTGKSSLLTRFISNHYFGDCYTPTMGVDFDTKVVCIHGKNFDLRFWDTAGYKPFRSIIPYYYKSCMAIFIVYDVTDKSSFEHAVYWINHTREVMSPNTIIVLVANKMDDIARTQVNSRQGVSLAEKTNVLFFEVSAKNGTNVEEMFNSVTVHIGGNMENSIVDQRMLGKTGFIVKNNECASWTSNKMLKCTLM